MIGLFQENGPCHFVNGQSTPSNNTNSWNNFANMLYVDQPIGTGFSYGTDDATSTVTAAPYVWTLLQAFYAQFPQYTNRNFGLFTESYGGHYGPEFASYFQAQNQKITSGGLNATKIPLVALGIKAYITFSANNSYNNIISQSQANSYLNTYNSQCVPALKQCNSLTGENSACESSDSTCYNGIEGPISQAKDFDVYDVRAPSNDPNPPETYSSYINQQSIRTKIGAKVSYTECGNAGFQKFSSTGDDSRSLLSTLGTVVSSGIQVIIWAGDAGEFQTLNSPPN
jgi:carboxypeptidase C (cathepsin A)